MKLLALLVTTTLLTGCATTPETQAKYKATGAFLAEKAAAIAGRVLLNSAVSYFDKDRKEDFLHSAATGLRTEMLSILNADDVRRVVDIWTPDKPHWGELAGELAEAYQKARQQGAPRDVAVEAVASGVQSAAMQ